MNDKAQQRNSVRLITHEKRRKTSGILFSFSLMFPQKILKLKYLLLYMLLIFFSFKERPRHLWVPLLKEMIY